MIIDKQLLLSSAQAITATAASTHIYDSGSAADQGPGKALRSFLQVDEAFNTLTSLTVTLETDDNTSFTSPTIVWSTKAILLAALLINTKHNLPITSRGLERYWRFKYTVGGSNPTLGKVTAGFVYDDQANAPTAAGI